MLKTLDNTKCSLVALPLTPHHKPMPLQALLVLTITTAAKTTLKQSWCLTVQFNNLTVATKTWSIACS